MPYPGKATRISRKGQWSTTPPPPPKKKKNKKKTHTTETTRTRRTTTKTHTHKINNNKTATTKQQHGLCVYTSVRRSYVDSTFFANFHWWRQTFRDDFGRQMRGDQRSPFSGVTNYGRVWRRCVGNRAWECARNRLLLNHNLPQSYWRCYCYSASVEVSLWSQRVSVADAVIVSSLFFAQSVTFASCTSPVSADIPPLPQVNWLNVFNAELSPKRCWREPRSQKMGVGGLYLMLSTQSPPEWLLH